MRILSLTLHNFGVYAYTNTFDLNSNKPIILIGGMNGRGKTTLLEAILLALYGRRSFTIADTKMSFANYLKNRVNVANGSYETFIELTFEIDTDNQVDIYRVKRWWSLHTSIPSIKTTVTKNGVFDQLFSDNWDLFIEEMLPSAIAPFFFFDGEKISDLANSNNDIQMKNSIKRLLGIDIIDQANADIHKIIVNKKRVVKAETYTKEIEEFETRLKKAETEVKEATESAGHLEIKKKNLEIQLHKAENSFSSMGGNLSSNKEGLLIRQSAIQEKLDLLNGQVSEIVAGDLPLLMTLPLLKDILSISEEEKKQKAIKATLEQLPALYREFDKSNENSFGIEKFLNFVKTNTGEKELIYNLTDHSIIQLNNLCSTSLTRQGEDIIKLLEQRQDLLSELDKIENFLAIDVDEKATGNKHQEVLKLTTDLATVTEQHRLARELVASRQAVFEELSRQQLKIIEKAVDSLEGATDIKRIITYGEYSINVLRVYKERLQAAKTHRLASTMTECFKQIVSKQNLISEINIDPISLDFTYLDGHGCQIDRSSLSAGEKQLLVISMLWALGICSKKKLPIVIDTPLARLDSHHREALIVNYFPKASEQTILLSTDSEIFGTYYDLIQPYTGKEYTLEYNDVTSQTDVREGYFGGSIR